MIRRPPRSTRTDTLFPYTTLFRSRSRGVSVHRQNCATFARLAAKHPERVLPVEWGRQGRSSYSVDVRVRAVDRKALLKDLTNVIAQSGAHVLAVNSHLDDLRAAAELRFTLKVNDFEPLGHLLARSDEHTSELQSLMRISYA